MANELLKEALNVVSLHYDECAMGTVGSTSTCGQQ